MRFILPKPLHGWRAIAGEIGIIVVGVLIALGAQEMLSDYDWNRKVEAGEAALRREAEDMSTYYAEQITVSPCIVAQIDELRAKVLTAGGLEDVKMYESTLGQQIIRAPSRTYSRDTWTSLIADGTVPHMQPDRRIETTQYYSQLDAMRESIPETEALRQRLAVLADPITLDTQSKFAALSDLAQLRSRTALQTLVATQLLASLRDLGRLPPPHEVNAAVAESKKSGTVGVCAERKLPLGNWQNALAFEPVTKFPKS